MSGTMSAKVRSEDHFGPIVPEGARSPERSTPAVPDNREHATRRHELVEQMRVSVVKATMATDLATKVELWKSYRAARADALAMLASVSDTPNTRRLRSV